MFSVGFKKVIVICFFVSSCQVVNEDFRQAEQTIVATDFASDIEVLASDEFEGRAPSSRGEEKTVTFLKNEFEKLGLGAGNEGSFFQEVPLVAISANPDIKLQVQAENQSRMFDYAEGFMAWTKRVVGKAGIKDSELVFVGYGAVAPEYNWDDYSGLDLTGKTVVILVNDPGFATQDDKLFNGNAMTYYGRWTYKFEEAARQGAEGALIIHEPKAAGYPWEVVTGSWSGKQFDLVSNDNNMSRCAVEGWLSFAAAHEIFSLAGMDLDNLMLAAQKSDFQPVSLGVKASLTLENNIEHSRSKNVIAMLPGRSRPDEVIIYTAHWDHFGKVDDMEGDNIHNGAFDNATGTAALIEIAEAFSALETKPDRSIVFLAVTAEEQGLLGSRHYATNPVFATGKTVAAINVDGMNVYGKMNDITVVGYGNSELDDYVKTAAQKQNRTVRPDPEPEKGYFYRSDHFSFAKVGVPALYTDSGIDHVEHGPEWTQNQLKQYTAERYHKPADEYDPDWDLSGAIDDMRLLFDIGYRLANEDILPNWREGNEFRAIRDADMMNDITVKQ